jgi:hypothetical protein
MCPRRDYRLDFCAVFAILVGLFTAAASWADTPWPPNEGPHSVTGLCVAASEPCADIICHQRMPGDDPASYQCGTSVWNALKRLDYKLSGDCSGSTGSCTKYDKVYCAYRAVYDVYPCNLGTIKCKYFLYVTNQCDPNE